jgi:hypothetical protein
MTSARSIDDPTIDPATGARVDTRPAQVGQGHRWRPQSRFVQVAFVLAWAMAVMGAAGAAPRSAPAPQQSCAPVPDSVYDTRTVNPPPTNRPAEEHPDLNLSLRGYAFTAGRLRLVDYNGDGDAKAPQLPGIFADQRTPTFAAAYKVYDWDWAADRPGKVLTQPHTSLLGLTVTPDETLYVPDSGYTLGDGMEVLVLYASPERVTLKYTADDSVAGGYTLHLEGICVDPNLVALYESCNGEGRARLPALRPRQPFARARDTEIGVAIRDNGTFMDPRSRKDWWRGR